MKLELDIERSIIITTDNGIEISIWHDTVSITHPSGHHEFRVENEQLQHIYIDQQMTKKIFKMFASAILSQYQEDLQRYPNPLVAEQRREAAMAVVITVAKVVNPKFDERRFRNACTGLT